MNNIVIKDNIGSLVEWELTPKTVSMNMPKLPIRIFQQVSAFMRWASKEHNGEATVSLTIHNGEWVVIPWHQVASGSLHVKFDPTQEENVEEFGHLEQSLSMLHCTIHSHNKAGAGQSGDDAEDELPKNGWHVTIGHCDKDKLDFHMRYNFRKKVETDQAGQVTMNAIQNFIKLNIKTIIGMEPVPGYEGMEDGFIEILMHKSQDFPEEWKEKYTKNNIRLASKATGKSVQQYFGNNIAKSPKKDNKILELSDWDQEKVNKYYGYD